MYSYGSRVPTRDRWAIVAYIRALQLSQNAPAGALPPGLNPAKPQVLPPLEDPHMKYKGPSAGEEYHGAGIEGEENIDAANKSEPVPADAAKNEGGHWGRSLCPAERWKLN